MKVLHGWYLSALLVAVGLLALSVASVGEAEGRGYYEVTLGDCYTIKFMGFEYEAGDYESSVWRYRVKEGYGCKDLSNWVLALPGCKVLGAYPSPWEYVEDEPHTGLDGVKWETDDYFQRGTFSVKVEGLPSRGYTDVAAKAGTDVFGPAGIIGPVCEGYAN